MMRYMTYSSGTAIALRRSLANSLTLDSMAQDSSTPAIRQATTMEMILERCHSIFLCRLTKTALRYLQPSSPGNCSCSRTISFW